MNIVNNITALFKVSYDKTFDYCKYYLWDPLAITHDSPEEKTLFISHVEKDIMDTIEKEFRNSDRIEDYSEVIKVDSLTKEKENKRIFRSEGFFNEYYYFFSKPTHVIDNIYLGSAYNAASYYDLKSQDIKLIVNVTKEISRYYPDDFTYLNYDIYDNNEDSISKYLEEAYQKIIELQKDLDGNILIHCYMGSSRSASLVLYYLMKTAKNSNNIPMSHEEALNFLKNKRPIINPTFRLTKDLAKSIMIK